MKKYRLLSKVTWGISVVGILAAVVNAFTGFLNAGISAGGTAVCIMGFSIAGIGAAILERERK